jgi:hypothetical protein
VDTFEKFAMNCEQAEALVLDLDRDRAVQPEERAAVLAHLSRCSRCAALQESWETAREDLRLLVAETQDAQAPERVKMRLMLEFRTQHRNATAKRMGFVAAWALAGAAVAVMAVGVWNLAKSRPNNHTNQDLSAARNTGNDTNSAAQDQGTDGLAAELTNGDDFTLLPGALPNDSDDSAIVRVRMQRSSLNALGFPVNEQRASEWIQVDLLVGNDGLPQAVRLAPEEN